MPWPLNIHTRSLRKITKVLALGLLALTLSTACLVAWLTGTETGRLFVVQSSLQFIGNNSDYQIEVQQLASPRLGEWRFSGLVLKHKQHPLIQTASLELRWQPMKLRRKQLIVDSLIIEQLIFNQAGQSENKEPAAEPFSLAKLLENPLPPIHIKHLHVIKLSLPNLFIDAAKTPLPPLALTGELNLLQGKTPTIQLAAQSLVTPTAHIQLNLTQPQRQQILLAGNLEEAKGGFFATLLKLPPQQAIELQLDALLKAEQDAYHLEVKQLNTPIAQHQVALSGQLSSKLDFSSGELRQLELHVDEHTHQLEGQWDQKRIQAQANIKQLPIDISSPWQSYLKGGWLSAKVKLEGPINTPRVDGSFELDTHYQNKPLKLSTTGSGNGAAADIKTLEGRWGEASVTAKGRAAWQSNDSNLHANVKALDLAALKDFGVKLPNPLNANILEAKAQLNGRIQDIEGNVNAFIKGKYAEQDFQLNIDLGKTGDTLAISDSLLNVAGGETHGQGVFNIKTLESKLKVYSESLPLSLLSLLGVNLPEELQALAEGECEIEGDIRKPSVRGKASLKGQYQEVPFYLQTEGSYKKQSLKIQQLTVSTFDTPVLDIYGEIHPKILDLQLNAKRLPTKLLSALGLQIEPGEFSADLVAKGERYTPDINGYLSYGVKDEIPFDLRMDIHTEHDTYVGQSQLSVNKKPSGQVSIHIPRNPYRAFFQQGSALDIQQLPLVAFSKGLINLRFASSFIDPDLHIISGLLDSQMNLAGTLQSPQLITQLNLTKGAYKNPSTGTQLKDIHCTLQTEQRVFRIEDCEASDGKSGSVKLQGLLRLVNKEDQGFIGISALAEQAQFLRRPDIESEASGNIELRGNFASLFASGKLEFAPLTALIDATYTSDIPKIEYTKVEHLDNEQNKEKQKAKPIIPTIELDFLVSAGQQAYIRGRGLEAELSGEVRLRGTTEKPRYDGEFKTLRGTFEVFGKKFTLEQGQVNFSNNAIALNIEGVYNKNDQLIRAVLSGTAEKPSLNLSAEPSMAEDEILAFIIFGKSVQDITPFEALQLASSAQTLSGGGGSFFDPIGSARELLGVDTLSIETETDDEGETNFNVGVGKYLNEKVYLEIERTPNPSRPWKGNLQIELAPNVHLESATGETSGIDGAKIKWKRDY